MTGMTLFFEFLLFALATIVFVYLYRVIRGPTVFDRVLGLNGIATKSIILLVAIGTVYGTGRDVRGHLHRLRAAEPGVIAGRSPSTWKDEGAT